jgi:hypothetical protein
MQVCLDIFTHVSDDGGRMRDIADRAKTAIEVNILSAESRQTTHKYSGVNSVFDPATKQVLCSTADRCKIHRFLHFFPTFVTGKRGRFLSPGFQPGPERTQKTGSVQHRQSM